MDLWKFENFNHSNKITEYIVYYIFIIEAVTCYIKLNTEIHTFCEKSLKPFSVDLIEARRGIGEDRWSSQGQLVRGWFLVHGVMVSWVLSAIKYWNIPANPEAAWFVNMVKGYSSTAVLRLYWPVLPNSSKIISTAHCSYYQFCTVSAMDRAHITTIQTLW